MPKYEKNQSAFIPFRETTGLPPTVLLENSATKGMNADGRNRTPLGSNRQGGGQTLNHFKNLAAGLKLCPDTKRIGR